MGIGKGNEQDLWDDEELSEDIRVPSKIGSSPQMNGKKGVGSEQLGNRLMVQREKKVTLYQSWLFLDVEENKGQNKMDTEGDENL